MPEIKYTPPKYLEPTDEGAFVDFPSRERAGHLPKTWAQCPKCFGHGGWNLKLNDYPLHGRENTPENRHKFSHFMAHCGQCNGWGWVSPDNVACIHTMVRHKNVGNCLNEYKCSQCGRIETIDSSG